MSLDASEGRATKQHIGGVVAPAQEPDQKLPCPRCDSTNTKFCYYNNYNLSQPRYFCNSCRRYWTHGGTLRDIPVGGDRKNAKRSRIYPSTPTAVSPHVASGNSPFLVPLPPRNMNGNFTSFLSSHALGGFEDMSFGIGRTAVWPFPGAVDSYVRHNNNGVGADWQLSGGEGGFIGRGDHFN